MTAETLPTTTQTTDEKRQLALLKAIGLDRAAPEQREIALHIANRYDLDLLLKHLVLIEGRPYITRDGLLHIAHRSGVLDGIETTVPEVVGRRPISRSVPRMRCAARAARRAWSGPSKSSRTASPPHLTRSAPSSRVAASRPANVALRMSLISSAPTLPLRASRSVSRVKPEMSTKTTVPFTRM